MDTIDRLIDEVRTHNVTLADVLTVLADDFRFDEILALIQEAKV